MGQNYSNEVVENKYRSSSTTKRNNTSNLLPSTSRASDSQDGVQNYDKNYPNGLIKTTRKNSIKRQKQSDKNVTVNETDIIDLTQDTEADLKPNEIKQCNESYPTRIFCKSKTKNDALKSDRSLRKSKNVAISSIMKQKEDMLNEKKINSDYKVSISIPEHFNGHNKSSDVPIDVSNNANKNLSCLQPKSSDIYIFQSTSNKNIKKTGQTVADDVQDMHITELNSMDKVKMWLNSDLKYGHQLSNVGHNVIQSKPQKFTANSDTDKLYKELMDKKAKLPVPNNEKKSNNVLWDYIEKKV